MHAAVEPHAANGAVHVCGVTRQYRAAHAEVDCDALVHGIGRAVYHLVRLIARQKALKLRLDIRVAEYFFGRVFNLRRKMHAPALRLRPLEEVGPLLRIGQVIAVTITARLVEVIGHRHRECALGIGITLEFNVQRFADDAASALGANDVAAA